MAQPHNTPEYRLPRTDLKDPETTCRGIKADGQRCRRTVVSAKSSPFNSPSKGANLGAGVNDSTAAPLFCWQHKDQALHTTTISTETAKPVSKMKPRSSIETLVERVGLLDVNDTQRPASEGRIFERRAARRKEGERRTSDPRLDRRPVQNHGARRHSVNAPRRHAQNAVVNSPSSRKKSSSGRKLVCFFTRMSDDEDVPVTRVRHRRAVSYNESRTPHLNPRPKAVQPPFRSADIIHESKSRHSHRADIQYSSQLRVPEPSTPNYRPRTSQSSLSPSSVRPHRPSLQGSPASTQSHTDTLLSWIPSTLSPTTTSALLKELSELISDADEPGYIYLCWVTPQTSATSPPPAELASSLISDNSEKRKQRASEIMRSAGVEPNMVHDPQQNNATDTMILKIGRTTNVHRRMNQWKEQCAHNLTLMRYYPYVPSSTLVHSGAPIPPRKVPHTHRVERLVHLELADRRVKLLEPCTCCGRKHKEWFEIRADREQLRIIDECVRRWVRWSELTGV
ncbi:hypothetical protein AJ79_00580 [Helicocarpus griseus UAMH5409]|uniref:Bacteriophage T5 Orf172 DNA-binding domain-containing protein n=1 Tax=Helicocarpus griseus UAMH5409 TaxID=1447875 RepID=A0A2B7YB07_9EURO|nr:hypothetical protein AJ79_00580 [Helicocarpus griseus UAMH5409]